MLDWDDLVLGPCAEAFGEPCVYVPKGMVGFGIVGVYDEGYEGEIVLVDGSTEIATTNPVLGVRAALFAGRRPPEQGDEVQVTRIRQAFKVQNVKPDGKGDIKLELNYAADL